MEIRGWLVVKRATLVIGLCLASAALASKFSDYLPGPIKTRMDRQDERIDRIAKIVELQAIINADPDPEVREMALRYLRTLPTFTRDERMEAIRRELDRERREQEKP